jgi:nucleoside-diphosphate-sugar epimerase
VRSILVTGASGFLGSHFLDWFLRADEGFDLWPMDIVPHPAGLPYDLQDIELWLEDFNVDIDIAIHMAGVVGGRQKIEGDPLYNADQLRIDSVFFRWAVKHAKTVVYPSSSAVYGAQLQVGSGIPLSESLCDVTRETWLAPDEMYGFTKLAGEKLAWSAAKYGLNTLIVRPFSGYGEGQSFDYPVPSIARRALHREDPLVVWGPGTQTRDFVHVTDLVSAVMARLEHPVDGVDVMNIGSGTATSFNEVARTCADIVGYDPQIVNLGDMPTGVQSRYCDPKRMRRYYEPKVSLRDGLERVITFIRDGEETAGAQDAAGG